MLTATQCPDTSPYGLPSSGLKSKGPTCIALKRAMSRLGYLPWSAHFDEHFNLALSGALSKWDPGHTGYGEGRWKKIRAARVPLGLDHEGEYALDSVSLKLINDEWLLTHPVPAPFPPLVYVHDEDYKSYTGGFVHQTSGIRGNYGLDFMAAPGTPVLAVEAGTISRTSGNDPRTGVHGSGGDVFGWSVYLRGRYGFYYSTHYGRLMVRGGQKVKVGQVLGYVGNWPGDPGRSHTHLGYTSFTYISYLSTKKIRAVADAPRVDGFV